MHNFYNVNGVWQDGAGREVKTAPIQEISRYPVKSRIPYAWAEVAYKEYAAQYGTSQSQSLERLCERGGFGAEEIVGLLVDRVQRLERELQPEQERRR